ncbi:unnamed protein product, partial [marine sediment metagenome]
EETILRTIVPIKQVPDMRAFSETDLSFEHFNLEFHIV